MSAVAKMIQKLEFKQPHGWIGGPLNIVVIGAGGNGSEVVDSLAAFHHACIALGRSGGIHVTVIDDAIVREPNLVRQRFWPCDLNQYKAIALVNRYNLMLGICWEALPFRFPSVECTEAMRNAHIVISAVDLTSVRVAIADYPENVRYDAMWLDIGNGHRHGQAVFGALHQAKRNTYPTVDVLYPEIRDMQDDHTKSCSAAESLQSQDCLVNRTVATAALNIIWEVIRYGATQKNLVVVDLKTGAQSTHKFPSV